MNIDPIYRKQVALLLRIIPFVAKEKCFALKGGTAINLFVREMPRLSVDIDLVYLPLEDRKPALENISKALSRIQQSLEISIAGIRVEKLSQSDGSEAKLRCQLQNAQVKIEVNTTMRGNLLSTRILSITQAVQNEFNLFAAMQVISHPELFGGKLCAALDRQHPRDLFDVHHLLINEGLTGEMRTGFISCLLSGNRPIHEMLDPQYQDQEAIFKRQFQGMSLAPFSYEDFEKTREQLIEKTQIFLRDEDKQFLLSFKNAQPNWDLFSEPQIQDLPAVKWKLKNIQKLKKDQPEKHTRQLHDLEKVLNKGSTKTD